MCALSLRADIDGRDSLDGYRNGSRYYQGIAHEVPIRAVAATVMSVQGQNAKYSAGADVFRSSPKNGHRFGTSVRLKLVATKLRCPLLCKVKMSLGSLAGSVSRRRGDLHIAAAPASAVGPLSHRYSCSARCCDPSALSSGLRPGG